MVLSEVAALQNIASECRRTTNVEYRKDSGFNSVTSKSTDQIIKPAVENKPATPPTAADHVKRTKKPAKVQRMNEAEARKILATLGTPGDPLLKYDLRDKLGSG